MTALNAPWARRFLFHLMCALAIVATPDPTAAQSRAEEIERQQAEKKTRLVPNVENGTERALSWFEDHFTDPNTLYLTFGGIYPSAGFAPGIGLRRAFGHARLNLKGAYSLRSYKLGEVSLNFTELADNKLEIHTIARWFDATQVPFYGLGNDSQKELRSSYGLEALELGGGLTLRPVSWFQLGANVAAERPKNSEGTGTRPSIELTHPPSQTPGLFSEPKYLHSTASLAFDWRESPGYTRRGGLYAFTFHDYRDGDDAFSFRRLDVDFRQFFPVLNEHWAFAFRALARITDRDAGQVIPYYLLPSL